MKLPRALIPTLVLGLLSVLSLGSRGFAAEMDKAAKELVKLDDDWSATASKRDVDGMVSYYATDAHIYPPNEPMALGHEGAKKVWSAGFSDPSFSISWKTATATVAQSGELGVTTGTYVASFKGPEGKMLTQHGKYVCVWKKDAAGKWKAIHDTWNSDEK